MPYRNILVASDGSKLSLKAATHAIALAKAIGARLTPRPGYEELPPPRGRVLPRWPS